MLPHDSFAGTLLAGLLLTVALALLAHVLVMAGS